MSRPPLAPILCSLLGCSLILTSGVGFAADESQPVAVENTTAANTAKIQRKLERIIIPKLEFREATIREAIDFLKKKSAELDAESPAGERGVNMVLKLAGSAGSIAASGTTPAVAERTLDPRITVSLTNIPLIEALKYVTGLANLKFKIEPYAVSVVPLSESTDVLVTKEWKIPPDLIPSPPASGGTPNGGKSGAGSADRVTAKNWLIANGVTFGGSASAIYIAKTSRLIVRNTQDQLDLVDTIIKSGPQGNGAVRVELECRFVEIQRDVGAGGPTPAAPGNSGGGDGGVLGHAIESLLWTTPGMNGPAPAIGAIRGVFTDPQFQLIMRTLNQKKGVDFLSTPRMTLKSGQSAVIEMFRDFRRYADGTPPQIPPDPDSPAEPFSTPPAAGPAELENRNTGVTLEVNAVVGPDGYTIDLNLVPQMVEFDGFVSEGSPILSRVPNPVTGDWTQKIITPALIKLPILSAPKVTTSVSVFDGSTVALGGVIREDVQKGEENGNIAGADGDRHIQRNLVIFVSARLINPAGEAVRPLDEKEEVVDTMRPPSVAPDGLPPTPK